MLVFVQYLYGTVVYCSPRRAAEDYRTVPRVYQQLQENKCRSLRTPKMEANIVVGRVEAGLIYD